MTTRPHVSRPWPTASVIIPAHNEQVTISRTLHRLLATAGVGELEVVVVCNGCADRTADLVREMDGTVRLIEIPQPSKHLALRAGDAVASAFPRVYLDADVDLGTDDVRSLIAALEDVNIEAVAPRRVVSRDKASRVVRWYYDVWEELPQVKAGLFGRGVIAVSAAGHHRVATLPDVMSDDLAFSEAFPASARIVVEDARVIVHAPLTTADLLRRRVRVSTGNAQADAVGVRGESAKTSWSSLALLVAHRPSLIPRLPVFLGVTLAARWKARRAVASGDFRTWLRDESSRTGSL